MADSNETPRKLSAAEINQQIARIDGINGSAGHHLEDPYLRDLLRQNLAGEITGDEYDLLGMEHLRKQNAQ